MFERYDAEPESYYRDLLAEHVGGETEVRLPFGRADVVTETHAFEVEPISRWRKGVAQALQYAAQVPQRGAIALYGDPLALPDVHAALAALPEPGLELWWLADGQFVRVEDGAQAASYIPAPTEPEHAPEPEAEHPDPPLQQYNSQGFEIWWGGGNIAPSGRPEWKRPITSESIDTLVNHAPDNPPKDKSELRRLLELSAGLCDPATTATWAAGCGGRSRILPADYAYIAAQVWFAPPFTSEQRRRLRSLLVGTIPVETLIGRQAD